MKPFSEHKGFWTRENKRSFALSILFLILALIIQFLAGRHSATVAARSNFAGDLFLDNLPVVNLDILIVQGAILMWAGGALLLALRPRYLLFGLKAIALFIIVRSISINLTHIGIYPHQAVLDTDDLGYSLYSLFAFQGNYFFSGHTGLPFLMALIFWPNKFWRSLFFIISAVFGVTMLLAHVHYSIDVFAAPFITYGIFKISEYLFARDYALISSLTGTKEA